MSLMKLLFGAKAASTARKVNRLAKAAAPKPAARGFALGPVALAGTGDYDQEVVGESFYQDALDAFCGGKCEDGHEKHCTATLQPEPHNPHDKNAVAVIVADQKVAHLSRGEAKAFHADMRRLGAAGASATCKARINGGWARPRRGGKIEEGHYGVELDLAWPLERA